MKKFIGKFHYLTQDLPKFSHLQQATMACNAGANWIQYRCFCKTDEQMLEELHQIAQVCDDWGTTLIITQHYHLIKQADIQGVHIEDMDADLTIIRNKIGDDKTLGASANTLQQIINHHNNGADYVGCGPYTHTNTKPNNEAHWGLLGYKNAFAQLQQLKIEIPLIAAGGIKLNDVEPLFQTGIYGVAVSEAVNKALNPQQTFKDIYQSIY